MKESYVPIAAVKDALAGVLSGTLVVSTVDLGQEIDAIEASSPKGEEIMLQIIEALSGNSLPIDTLEPQDVPGEEEVLETEVSDNDEPKVKYIHSIIISDPNNKLNVDPSLQNLEMVGWVVQVPEETPMDQTLPSLYKAAYDFNASRKGRKNPIYSLGEALESIPAKFFREAGVRIKTKEPVYVLVSNNQIPKHVVTASSLDV